VCGISDILVALGLRGITVAGGLPGARGPGAQIGPTTYQGPDQALFEALSPDPTSLDRLALITGLSLAELCGGLERLAQSGVARDVGGWWETT
jgi:predicted Rossmann fold nucleotide-binding protein DprA/Smf involved in DNA uptake